MKIIVGSRNPIKIEAAQAVFSRVDPAAEVRGVAVASRVDAQPWGNAETQEGAVNRARAALQNGADLGVGFEGGLLDTEHGLMTCAWCAVIDPAGRVGLGGGASVLVPPTVAERVREGTELGPAMDLLVGEHNTKQGPGAIGILTDDLSDRQAAYAHILKLALARFRRPDLYGD